MGSMNPRFPTQAAAIVPSNASSPVDVPCCMCRNHVREMAYRTGRLYGLLQNCNHPFCLFCIRGFVSDRLVKNQREGVQNPEWQTIVCPVCWRPSSAIVASHEMTTDPGLKRLKFGVFMDNVTHLPCPYQRQGLGWCFCPDLRHKNTGRTALEERFKIADTKAELDG